MTDIKISDMPDAADPDGTETIPVVQSDSNKKMTVLQAVELLLAKANTWTRQQAVTPARGSMSGAVSIDLADLSNSTGVTWSGSPVGTNNLHLTLTGNVTSFALLNPVDGAVYNIRFIQDSTGSRTIALPGAFKFAGGAAPTVSTAAGAVDFLSAEYGSTEGTYMCGFQKGMA